MAGVGGVGGRHGRRRRGGVGRRGGDGGAAGSRTARLAFPSAARGLGPVDAVACACPPRARRDARPVWWGPARGARRRVAFLRLLAVFAVKWHRCRDPPATVLFFVADARGRGARRRLPCRYFLAAAAGLPPWTRPVARIGKAARLCRHGARRGGGSPGRPAWQRRPARHALHLRARASRSALTPPRRLPCNRDLDTTRGRGPACPLHARSRRCRLRLVSFVTKANLALAAGLALPLSRPLLGYALAEPSRHCRRRALAAGLWLRTGRPEARRHRPAVAWASRARSGMGDDPLSTAVPVVAPPAPHWKRRR